MPELPEVETTKTSLTPLLGQRLVDVKVFQPKLRWMMPDDLNRLVGYTLDRVERRAKYLILTFLPITADNPVHADNTMTAESDTAAPCQLMIHLGMSGSLQQHKIGSNN